MGLVAAFLRATGQNRPSDSPSAVWIDSYRGRQDFGPVALSEDKGRTWQRVCWGEQSGAGSQAYDLALDPQRPGVMYGAFSSHNDVFERKVLTRNPAGMRGCVVTSTDGGKTWKTTAGTNSGLPESGLCTSLLLEPASPPNARVLLASFYSKGVYRSDDGGKSWREASTGMGENRNVWHLRRAADGTIYVVVLRQLCRKRLPGALYRSINGGANWEPVVIGDPLAGLRDLCIDPRNQSVLYATSGKPADAGGTSPGGLYKSLDAGKTWTRIFTHEHAIGVNLDPARPDNVYLSIIECGGLHHSPNGGRTWTRVEQVPHHSPLNVYFDPSDQRVWVSTWGNALWVGPAHR